MDEDQIYIQVQKCKHLKFKFRGVFAADNYPLNLPVNSFIIVNFNCIARKHIKLAQKLGPQAQTVFVRLWRKLIMIANH